MKAARIITLYFNALYRALASGEPTLEGLGGKDSWNRSIAAGGQAVNVLDGNRGAPLTINTNGVTTASRIDIALDQRLPADFLIIDGLNILDVYAAAVRNQVKLYYNSTDNFGTATEVVVNKYVSGLLGKGRPYLKFTPDYGDVVTVASHANLNFGTGDFAIEYYGTIEGFLNQGSTYNVLAGKGNVVGGPAASWSLVTQSDNLLQFVVRTGGTKADSDSALNDGAKHHILAVRSGGTLKMFVDVVLQETTGTQAGDVDNATDFLIGRDSNVAREIGAEAVVLRLWNRDPSDIITTLYDVATGQVGLVPAGDQGASQGDLVTNGEDWTGATGSTPPNNWSDTGAGTATYLIRDNTPVANFGDDKALDLSTSGGSKTLYQGVAQSGKRHRVSFVYRNLDGSSSSYVALGSDSNKVTLQNSGISGDGILFEQELLADGTDLKFFVDSGGTLQIDHVQVVQVGCVAEWSHDGISKAQTKLLDGSGNGHHGVVTNCEYHDAPAGDETGFLAMEFDEIDARYLFIEFNGDELTGLDDLLQGQVCVGKVPTLAGVKEFNEKADYPGIDTTETQGGADMPSTRYDDERGYWPLLLIGQTRAQVAELRRVYRAQKGKAWPFYLKEDWEGEEARICFVKFDSPLEIARRGDRFTVRTAIKAVAESG